MSDTIIMLQYVFAPKFIAINAILLTFALVRKWCVEQNFEQQPVLCAAE